MNPPPARLSYDELPEMDPQLECPIVPNKSAGTCATKLLSAAMAVVRVFFPSMIFVKFFLSSIIPPLANIIIPLFFVGNIPDQSSLAITSQFTFISIILEVFQEGVGNSLFHFVGTHYEQNRRLALAAFKLALAVLLVAGLLLMVVMLLCTPQFVDLIDTPADIVEATRRYLYLSSFAFVPILLNTAFTNYLLITTSSWLVASQLLSVVLSFCTNFFLFGQQATSLHWGVDQLGYYQVIQSTLIAVCNATFVLVVEKMSPWRFLFGVSFFNQLKPNFRAFFSVSWGNFLDSAVRNFFYFAVTLTFFNNLGENDAGAWNLLNSIIWGLILIPAVVIANYAKVRIGHDSSRVRIRRVARESFISLGAWTVVCSLISVFLWPNMAAFFSKSNQEIQELSETMLHTVGWIFIVYACNNTIDSFFLGTGKTKYVFYQSFITNMLVYFVPWILYLTAVVQPSYMLVIGLYIMGMLVDFCLTTFFAIRVWNSMGE